LRAKANLEEWHEAPQYGIVYTKRRKVGRMMEIDECKEVDWYPEVSIALKGFFTKRGYHSNFQVLGGKSGKKPTDEYLQLNPKLRQYRRYLPVPDIMGLVWRKEETQARLVVAEFKLKPKFADIFKTKGYHELFKARLTFLIGRESVSESSPAYKYIKNAPKLIRVGKTKILCLLLQPLKEGGYALARLGSEPIFDWDKEMDKFDKEFS
jgi:hypothetical protein